MKTFLDVLSKHLDQNTNPLIRDLGEQLMDADWAVIGDFATLLIVLATTEHMPQTEMSKGLMYSLALELYSIEECGKKLKPGETMISSECVIHQLPGVIGDAYIKACQAFGGECAALKRNKEKNESDE